ncbi:MAG: hypothetical protein HY056_10840 [Proteobacteria bacterium]|nr:hypothetical protein [Pseudomonadota bacterium]
MIRSRLRRALTVPVFIASMLSLGACAGISLPSFNLSNPFGSSDPPPPVAATPTPSIRPDDLVGRWGLASFLKPDDRARTEAAARNQCNQPYTIARGPGGGVMMHLYDNPQIQELTLKANSTGTNYIGPAGEPGGLNDREVTSFDGRVMILRWVDSEVASRYGTMVYARCAPPGTPSARR